MDVANNTPQFDNYLLVAILLAILQAILLFVTIYEKTSLKTNLLTAQREKRLMRAASILLVGTGITVLLGVLVQLFGGSVLDYFTVLTPFAAIVTWYGYYSVASKSIDLGLAKEEIRDIYGRWITKYIMERPKEVFTDEKIYDAIRWKPDLVEDIYNRIPQKTMMESLFPKEYVLSLLAPVLIDKGGVRDILNELARVGKLSKNGGMYRFRVQQNRMAQPPPTSSPQQPPKDR